MSIRPWPTQDPQANLDYWFDLSGVIAEQSSALSLWSIAITGDDDALTKSGEVESGGVIYFWLATPTEDANYTVTCHFELANGYADDISRTLKGESH
jgi:hypothetical protein